MTSLRKWAALAATASFAVTAANHTISAHASKEKPERARVAVSHALPQLNGNHLEATLVVVTYGPGESSTPHSHPCPVIGCVIEGAIHTQMKGESEATYKVGESFYEAPNGVHLISANASQTERAKFLAYFVCDHQASLSIDAPQSNSHGEN